MTWGVAYRETLTLRLPEKPDARLSEFAYLDRLGRSVYFIF